MTAREVFYSAEYAKTDRSTCKKSKKTIPAGALRIGRSSPSPFHDGYVVQWFALQPFFQTKYCKDIASSSMIRGFDRLRNEDQEKIRSILGESVDAGSSKNDLSKLWQVKDYLTNNASLKELKNSLELNGVRNTGGQDRLVNRVADGIVFGKATCATCPHQDLCQLKFEDGQYNCVAELQWGTCGYKGTSVVIHKWKRKSELFEHHFFLKNWSEDPEARPLSKITRAPVKEYNRNSKLPLKGMKFAAAGRLPKRSHAEIKTLITRNGGAFSDTISADLDYVISTFPGTLTERPKIKQAKELQLAIVTELLVDRLLEEFGFDQNPYLLSGTLPPIAHATLAADTLAVPAVKEEQKQVKLEIAFKKGIIDAQAKCPNGKVHKDDDASYDLMLLQTDIQTGENKFYQLQIIDVNGNGNKFIVFRKWGRVGTTVGGSTVTSPSSFESALEFFEEHYLDKTGNEWENRKEFKKMPGKYFPVEVEEEEQDKKQDTLLQDNIPSYLDPRVASVVDLIFDVDMITREMKSLEIDVRKMPLGKLTQAHIKKGYTTLTEIEQVLKSDDESKSFKLLNLSNQFYTLIPTDFGMKKLELIDNFDTLQLKMKQLEVLMDIQVASSLMNEQSIVGQHPTDTNYQRLGIKLAPLSKYSREYKTIERYITNGYDPNVIGYSIGLEEVFTVDRPEDTDFASTKSVRPRKLLWHGSRLCNYVGILNQGLRIAPAEAPTSGYMFGKGLYFADRIQKSAPFCHLTKENPTGLLLLSDVVVGEQYKVKKPEYIEKLPDGKNSTLVLAKIVPDPSKDEIGEDKVIVPSGPGVPSYEKDVFLEDQEYVVYSKQAQIKFLVKVKRN